MQQTFEAVEVERNDDGPVLLKIGGSLVWIEAGEVPPNIAPWVGSVYVYVADVDAVYARAVSLGARPIAPAARQAVPESQAGVVDAGGNIWWISTYNP